MSREQTLGVALDEKEVARRLALSVATLRAWRQNNRGPRYMRFGRAVRYLPSDIEAYVERSAVDTRPESAPHLLDDPKESLAR